MIGGEYVAGAVLLVIILIAELIAEVNTDRARASIKALIGSVPQTALVRRSGGDETIPIAELSLGDIVIVRAGEKILVAGAVSRSPESARCAAGSEPQSHWGEQMNFNKSTGAILLAALVITPGAMAHDPKEHAREEAEMMRVPVQIQPAPDPAVAPKPELPKIRFAEMDTDGDRRITREEWRGNGSAFRKLNRNKDGVLAGVEVEVPVKAQPK